jgi:hypothetical protein
VGIGDYVRLNCEPQTLEALASGLTHYGPSAGAPEWLVSAVWLYTPTARFIATATIAVLPDGFVARGLGICRPEDFTKQLKGELPDVAARVTARGNGMTLPSAEEPPPPDQLKTWSTTDYETHILIRASRRATGQNHVACALLFTDRDGTSLLLGSDPSTLALVLSDDPALIERYRNECAVFTLAEYLADG